jgi:hypothetical protein
MGNIVNNYEPFCCFSPGDGFIVKSPRCLAKRAFRILRHGGCIFGFN